MKNVTIARLVLLVAVFCLGVAFIITAGWVDAAGDARDAWLIGGLALFAGSFLVPA